MTNDGIKHPSGNTDVMITGREIIITRVFDARREMIWDAWTDPEQVVKWWGPQGFSLDIRAMDVRIGGRWESTMHGPDGTKYLNICEFTEVVKPERISYRLVGGTDQDMRAQVSWIFEALQDKTKLTLRMLFPTGEEFERAVSIYRAVDGGNETLDRLREHLKNGVLH